MPERPGISWLHLTDFHTRSSLGSLWQRSDVRPELERDLRHFHDIAGPFDLVLITGDIASTGAEAEFALASEGILSLLAFLWSLGSTPAVLAVPGNHDLALTSSAFAPNPFTWESDPSAREAFFHEMRQQVQATVNAAFSAFARWQDQWIGYNKSNPQLSFAAGMLPGDFLASFKKGGIQLGIIGLNTAFLEVASSNATGLLDVDVRQVLSPALALQNLGDVSLLLTHHHPEAFSAPARHRLANDIAKPGQVGLHLCGGRFEAGARRALVASHSFSAPHFSGSKRKASGQGYALGRIELGRSQHTLKLWPRILTFPAFGPTLVADRDYDLDADEAITQILPPRAPAAKPAAAAKPASASAPASAPASASASAPASASASAPAFPSGFSVVHSVPIGRSPVSRIRFSPGGDAITVLTYWGKIVSWDTQSHQQCFTGRTNSDALELCYSEDGKHIATRAGTHLSIWDTSTGKCLRTALEVPGVGLAWGPGSVLAVGTPEGKILFYDAEELALLGDTNHGFCAEGIFALAFSPDGEFLLSAGKGDGFVAISTIPAGALPQDGFTRAAHFHRGSVLDFAFRPRAPHVASAADDGTIAVWSLENGAFLAKLEGHTTAITGLSFSFDGRILASRSRDGVVLLWRSDTWEQVARLQSMPSSLGGATFSPKEPILAIASPTGNLTLLHVDIDALRGKGQASSIRFTTTAKVVLLGEGRAGKSCLALRLAEDRFEDQPSTHGMRFWTVPEERLPRIAGSPKNHRRELVVWDLGGQEEYRLVHPLFLRDTELALLVFEPGRGKTAETEIASFNDHLVEDEERGKPPRRLLVGSKLDSDAAPADPAALERLRVRTGALAYTPTSAKENRGIDALKEQLTAAIEWAELGPTARPALFERIRAQIERARRSGRIVLSLAELETAARAEAFGEEFDRSAISAVASQLARQGIVADIRLSDGTRALVLEVEQIARYASSIVLLAKQNLHGVPALDQAALYGRTARFPRIPEAERLPRDQEMGVVDGVISLFLEHGTCFLHEGLLVFPALFPEGDADEAEAGKLPAAMTYEMSRPTAEVFASAVAALALSRRFGPARLSQGRADFGRPNEGISRLSMLKALPGKARGALTLSFSNEAPDEVRRLFAGFFEDHLKQRGVHFVEKTAIHCACGYALDPDLVSKRLVAGYCDIGCPSCDIRIPLIPKDPSGNPIDAPIFALRREAERRREESVEATRIAMTTARIAEKSTPAPLRILHLSDLHLHEKDDPEELLGPLCLDLRDRVEGLSLEKLDFVVISGDLTNRASQGELEKARIFLSRLLEEMGLNAERCLVVPGNHDLNWDVDVYPFHKKRAVDPKCLVPGTFIEQPNGYLVRDDARYGERFRHFSEHLYHPLFLREYPMAVEEQGIATLFANERLQFLAFNSAHQIDEYFPSRSGICTRALSRAIDAAEKQIKQARTSGALDPHASILRLSIFHHPPIGQELMADTSFLETLRKSDVKVALFGHIHEERVAIEGHLSPTRKLHLVGAGSFRAPGPHRPESVPRLYNVLTIDRDLKRMRVDTRAKRKEGGAWQAFCVWPGEKPQEMRSFYEVTLE